MLQDVGCEAELESPSKWTVEIHRCGEAEGLHGYLAGRKKKNSQDPKVSLFSGPCGGRRKVLSCERGTGGVERCGTSHNWGGKWDL